MIYGNNSKWMLKYQKAKTKLLEYNVPREYYPKFKLDSNDLVFSTTYILSRYSECVINNEIDGLKELEPFLTSTAQYYDATVRSQDCDDYNYDFLLCGSTAYFLSNDFGSSKVLVNRADIFRDETHDPQQLIIKLLSFLLNGKRMQYIKVVDLYSKINNAFLDFFEKGEESQDKIVTLLNQYRNQIFSLNNADKSFYIDVLFAVVIRALQYSSWALLPKYSYLSEDKWRDYLTKRSSIKMLWPAQQLIGEKGILRGENAIVQLPTGVGKTKGIELIIRSAFLSERASNAIIVAPLRALCNEITSDMMRAFDENVKVNQFSDVLQNDIAILFGEEVDKQIMVCTPEKLSYIVHHDPGFVEMIDLFVFDEGHMFDDGSRGATYEFLVSHIKKQLNDTQQFVLLSAVLPNSQQIIDWLFKDKGVLATDSKIVSTPKSVGFASGLRDVHYYTDDPNVEDYFIPNILAPQKLKRLPRERTDKYFPVLDSSIDVSLYNSIRLCPNGGVALYISQQRSLKTVLERVLDLQKRDYDISNFTKGCNKEEIEKIGNLIAAYYGRDFVYSRGCYLGVLPHTANIPNGVKLSVEYALKHDHARVVVCTSTLAQGVNIPIKYLCVTGLRSNRALMKTRNFQNLIGRTARSGVYTEGSIIISDTKIFDEKNTGRGKYQWEEYIAMFDANSSEPCGSSILSAVKNIIIDYRTGVKGTKFVDWILTNFDDPKCFENFAANCQDKYFEYRPEQHQSNIFEEVMFRKAVFESIENYLCLAFIECEKDERENIGLQICRDSLAYSLADEVEKELLEKVFLAIISKLDAYSSEQLQKYSYAMSSVGMSSKIEAWISDNELTATFISEDNLLDLIVDFYTNTHIIKKCSDSFNEICRLWVLGVTPAAMEVFTGCNMFDIDDVCNKNISYDLNFFIGNICDLITVDSEDEEAVNPYNTLNIIQKKIKYGVSTQTAISICEKVFNDRIIATKIAEVLKDEQIDTDDIIQTLKFYGDEIRDILSEYPEYFMDRFNFVIR